MEVHLTKGKGKEKVKKEEEKEKEKEKGKEKEKEKGKEKEKRKEKDRGDVKFLGVRKRPSSKYVAEIYDSAHRSIRLWLGTFNTAKKAARIYDHVAYAMRGRLAILNFPQEVHPVTTTNTVCQRGSDTGNQMRQRIELECLDNKLLDELLQNMDLDKGAKEEK